MTWEAIASVPKGKKVLVYGSGGMQFGYLDSVGNWRGDSEGRIRSVAPTHWMPIPNPPDAAAGR